MKIVKNKHAPPFRTAQFELEFGKGICQESEIIELGIKHKFISKGGAHYGFNGSSYHGKDALKRYLSGNDSVREELIMKLREKMLNAETEKEAETADTMSIEGGGLTEETVKADSSDEEIAAAVEV